MLIKNFLKLITEGDPFFFWKIVDYVIYGQPLTEVEGQNLPPLLRKGVGGKLIKKIHTFASHFRLLGQKVITMQLRNVKQILFSSKTQLKS